MNIQRAIQDAIHWLQSVSDRNNLHPLDQERRLIDVGKRLSAQTMVVGLRRMGYTDAVIAAEMAAKGAPTTRKTVTVYAAAKQTIAAHRVRALEEVYEEAVKAARSHRRLPA